MKKVLSWCCVALAVMFGVGIEELKAATAVVYTYASYFNGRTDFSGSEGEYLAIQTYWDSDGSAPFYIKDQKQTLWSSDMERIPEFRYEMTVWDNASMQNANVYLWVNGFFASGIPYSAADGGTDRKPQIHNEMANYAGYRNPASGFVESRQAYGKSKLFIQDAVPGGWYLIKLCFSAAHYSVKHGAQDHGDAFDYGAWPLDPSIDQLTCLGMTCDSNLSVTFWMSADWGSIDVTPAWVGGNDHWGYSGYAVVLQEFVPWLPW